MLELDAVEMAIEGITFVGIISGLRQITEMFSEIVGVRGMEPLPRGVPGGSGCALRLPGTACC